MTVPATEAFTGFVVFTGNPNYAYHTYQILVAANAVFLNHIDSGLFYSYYLRLGSGGKNGGVPHPVHRFEVVSAENIILGYMAIVACGNFTMTAVIP
jgi:hypothetical protein